MEPHLVTPLPCPTALTCLPHAMHQQLDMSVHLAHRTSSIRTAAGCHVQGRTRTLQGNCGQGLAPGSKVWRSKGESGSGGYMPRLPRNRWAPGFGTEQGTGAGRHCPTAAHCRTSPGAWERVAWEGFGQQLLRCPRLWPGFPGPTYRR